MPRKKKHGRTAAKSVKATKTRRAGARTPLYRKVLQTLKERILSGAYAVGTQLPTENELVVEIKVSRHTIRAALRQLRDDGVLPGSTGILRARSCFNQRLGGVFK